MDLSSKPWAWRVRSANVLISGVANGSGELQMSVPGGFSVQVTVVAQAVYLDGAQSQGFGLTNAVGIELLP